MRTRYSVVCSKTVGKRGTLLKTQLNLGPITRTRAEQWLLAGGRLGHAFFLFWAFVWGAFFFGRGLREWFWLDTRKDRRWGVYLWCWKCPENCRMGWP